MNCLIDGDPASNNGGWQWVAGTGTDAAPYFRIFNPITQGKRYDPDGEYIRQWVPELRSVPAKYLHEPWKLPQKEQARTGFVIGEQYPHPHRGASMGATTSPRCLCHGTSARCQRQ